MSPTIIIDTREQKPWSFGDVPTVCRKLDAGDYSVEGFETRIAIERKSTADLVGTLTSGRERFERELERLANFDRALIIVEGDLEEVIAWKYRSSVSPACIVGSLASFYARHNIATVFAGSARNAQILALAYLTKCAKHLTPPIAA